MLFEGEKKQSQQHPINAFHLSTTNEWYTPPVYIRAARKVLGRIDVDPASSRLANQVVQATTYYDEETNGLEHPWIGKVWLNPPYGRSDRTRQKSNVDAWISRLIEQYRQGITTEAILLVNAAPGYRWFDALWNYPLCFASVRISFYRPDGYAGRPTHSNVFAYLGPHEERFFQVFDVDGEEHIGPIVRRLSFPLRESPQLSFWEEKGKKR